MTMFTQCKNKKESVKSEDTQKDMPELTKKNAKSLTIEKGVSYDGSAPVTIKNAEINGDFLKLSVSYSGGCEEHEFDLLFNGMYAKSLPVQAKFFLKHNSNGDACKGLVHKELLFDVSELKKKQNHVIISVMGYKGKIEYKVK